MTPAPSGHVWASSLDLPPLANWTGLPVSAMTRTERPRETLMPRSSYLSNSSPKKNGSYGVGSEVGLFVGESEGDGVGCLVG